MNLTHEHVNTESSCWADDGLPAEQKDKDNVQLPPTMQPPPPHLAPSSDMTAITVMVVMGGMENMSLVWVLQLLVSLWQQTWRETMWFFVDLNPVLSRWFRSLKSWWDQVPQRGSAVKQSWGHFPVRIDRVNWAEGFRAALISEFPCWRVEGFQLHDLLHRADLSSCSGPSVVSSSSSK